MFVIKPSVRIENIVATVTMNQSIDIDAISRNVPGFLRQRYNSVKVCIDLDAISRNVPGVEYNPGRFPGLVYRLSKPRTATLIFSSGKMVCTGSKSEMEVHNAVKKVIENLKDRNIVITGTPEIKIQNIVASADLHAEVNEEKVASLLENTMYEPEQFPGLIYRMSEPKVVLLIFSSGKMVCTGAKREDEVKVAVEKVYQKLKDLGVLYEE
jgi:transcription initiation factor TFIID TATA-box-binding protein